jgi:hypothetical protein
MPCKRLHVTATRLAADAFAVDARQANNLKEQHRYNAACSAALAAAGQADDARALPDRVTLKLRMLAYHWLRADLALYAQVADHADPKIRKVVQQRLAHWQAEADLVSVRDRPALARLDADECRQWQRLWQEVERLRQVALKK